MNDSSNICLSCGFCCDGTVIGFVELSNEEIPVLRELMDIEEDYGKGFILQPCSSYSDGCKIYSKRAKQCANFKCGLLKSVENKELDFDSALAIISEFKQKKIEIEIKLGLLQIELQSPSFFFKIAELKKLLNNLRSESSLTQTHLELISDLDWLDNKLLPLFL